MPAAENVSVLVGDIPNKRLPMNRDSAIEANVPTIAPHNQHYSVFHHH